MRFTLLRFSRALSAVVVVAFLSPSVFAGDIDLKTLQPLEAKKKNGNAYVGVFAGSTLSQSTSMKLEYPDHSLRYRTGDEDGNFLIGFEVGYAWKTRYYVELGLEFEGIFGGTEINALLAGSSTSGVPLALGDTATAQADINYAAFMLNGVVTLDLRRLRPQIGDILPRFRPYVGGGIGGAQVFYRNQRVQTIGDLLAVPTPASVSPFSIDEFVFASQFFVGLEFKINDKLSLYGEYRKLSFAKTNDLQSFETDAALGGFHLYQ